MAAQPLARSIPGPPADVPVIRAEHVQVGYGGRIVWSDASFSVKAGEFIAVIGPNGAGKTTLFRLMLGLIPSTAGELAIFGERPRRGSPVVGYVPQRHSVDYETPVRALDLVRLGFSGHRLGLPIPSRREREAAVRALEWVGGSALAERRLGALSGGELQRIFLAEALVSDPRLLLLDEPLANLDLRRARELVALVASIVRSQGVTALLVAHDINALVPYLDKILYLANGRVAAGTPEQVLTSRSLSQLYGAPVEVLRDSAGRFVIVGGDEHPEGGLGGGEDHHEGEAPADSRRTGPDP